MSKSNLKHKIRDWHEDELESLSRHTRINTVRKFGKLKRQIERQQARLNKQIARNEQ